MGEACIARKVVDTEKQWLAFCYDEIENKNEDFIEIAFICVFHGLTFLFCHIPKIIDYSWKKFPRLLNLLPIFMIQIKGYFL